MVLRKAWGWLSAQVSQKDNYCCSCGGVLRTATEQWKKERPVLNRNSKLLVMCILFQFVHGLATNLARFLHIPQRPLYDLGFALIPKLEPPYEYLCDVVFCVCIVITMLVWISPFFVPKVSEHREN
eukprot:1048557-Amorphochlora_amoeboformis.AAC.1